MTPTQKLIAVNRIIKNRFNNITTDDSIILSDKIVQAMEDGDIQFIHKDIDVMGKLESIQALQKMVWEYEELKSKKVDFLHCNRCGKQVSTALYAVPTETPDKGLIVRAWIECPECIEAKSKAEAKS